ncbi:MAG: NADPH-dependent glutamate synthase [Candidatus Coatesbacteria bacterium]|nr:MAG: NADPH-dependent glutamate synthase [Candidatus Coatesbacteria bacterium]
MAEEKKKEKKEKKEIIPEKYPMQEQKPADRVKNFKEVPFGYDIETAKLEADRCLQCPKPFCIDGCPVEIDIPGFIAAIAEGDMVEAIRIMKLYNNLPAVCGRVCPQEDQCEIVCVLAKKHEPVAIGRLERFIADYDYEHNVAPPPEKAPSKGKKVAIVGAGPAGLTCAGDLARMGYDVTVFEAFHSTGGVLRYGIPEFRMPNTILDQEVDYVRSLGVDIQCNMVIGKVFTVEELMEEEGYGAVFIGTGAGLPRWMRVPGENLNGVYSANEYLTRINLMYGYKFPEYDTPIWTGKKVAVIGGGNTAMDSVRTSLRMGAEEAHIYYRRTEKEMPARIEEIHHAEEEGVKFTFLVAPIEVLADEKEWVRGMVLQRMELGEPDDSGRRRPLPIEGDTYEVEVDTVIVAVGTYPNPIIPDTTENLEISKWGTIVVDEETGMTNVPGVFAGGDIVTGGATVISAMGAGKIAARGIDAYLSGE